MSIETVADIFTCLLDLSLVEYIWLSKIKLLALFIAGWNLWPIKSKQNRNGSKFQLPQTQQNQSIMRVFGLKTLHFIIES